MHDFAELYKTLERAYDTQYSSFYRDKYERTGFHPSMVQSWDDWRLIPPVTKDELLETPYYERLYVPREEINFVRATSGTTGGGVGIFPIHEDRVRHLPEQGPTSFFLQRMMAFVYPSHFLASNCKHLLAGDPTDLTISAQLASALDIDSLTIFPQLLVLFIPHMETSGVILENIRYIGLVGDRTTQWHWNLFTERFPNAEIQPLYGLTEIGRAVGGACPHTPPVNGNHQLHPFSYVYWEIIDTESGELLEEEGSEGELLISTVDTQYKAALPFVRYRTGDLARLTSTHSSCSCGQKSSRYVIVGRAKSDIIKIPAGELRLEEIERVLGLFKEHITGEFELHVTETGTGSDKKTAVELKLEMRPASSVSLAFLAERIAQKFSVNITGTYADGVARGLYAPLSCTKLKKTALTPGSKVIRMHDDRV